MSETIEYGEFSCRQNHDSKIHGPKGMWRVFRRNSPDEWCYVDGNGDLCPTATSFPTLEEAEAAGALYRLKGPQS